MAKQTINIGTAPNDRKGDPLRTAFTKINSNFSELYSVGTANIGDITFDGVKVIGAGTASGDGNGYSTIEIVPDIDLYVNDQYLIIDPTAPSHIHIRAGGTQDNSSAHLIIGGENTNLTVDDQAKNIQIKAGNGINEFHQWTFGLDGSFSIPGGYPILFGNGNSRIQAGMGFHINSEEGIAIEAVNTSDPNNYVTMGWYFSPDGSFASPGVKIESAITKIGSNIPNTGEVLTVALNPTNNTNFIPGTYPGIFIGLNNGFTITLDVSINGDLTATVVNSGPGFQVNESGTLNGAAIAGGTTGIDDIGITITEITNLAVATPLDTTKSVNKLTDGYYTLANGVEGQIMYLVSDSTILDTSTVTVIVSNGRVGGNTYVDIMLFPFVSPGSYVNSICTLIFVDGYWQQTGGSWD